MTDSERIEYLEKLVALQSEILHVQQELKAVDARMIRALITRIENVERALAGHLEAEFRRERAQDPIV